MKILTFIFLVFSLFGEGRDSRKSESLTFTASQENPGWLILKKEDLSNGTYHTNHNNVFGKYVTGNNTYILKAIDSVQSTALDGGGYFTGLKVNPPESPIGFDLNLFGKQLLDAPRTTSYCSGASYAAFITGLNLMCTDKSQTLSDERLESLRMQEPDGGRREDEVKYWGKWNDNGYGNHFALVQYSGMGVKIDPVSARPGDFLNISWKSGFGHSVIFLGWYINEDKKKCVVYWSSQKGTNGLGDDIVPISKIKEVMFVRLSNPEKLFSFDVNKVIDRSVKGDIINW